jgi:hypothetical protein
MKEINSHKDLIETHQLLKEIENLKKEQNELKEVIQFDLMRKSKSKDVSTYRNRNFDTYFENQNLTPRPDNFDK